MKDSSGFTLVEVLVVVVLLGIMSAFAMPSVISANKSWESAARQTAGNFKVARAKSIAKTSAYRIQPVSATEFKVETAPKCESPETDWQTDYTFDVLLPKDTQLISPTYINGNNTPIANPLDWDICFTSRGAASQTLQITLEDLDTRNKKVVKVLKGGKVSIEES